MVLGRSRYPTGFTNLELVARSYQSVAHRGRITGADAWQ
jgi:hypothetical protein